MTIGKIIRSNALSPVGILLVNIHKIIFCQRITAFVGMTTFSANIILYTDSEGIPYKIVEATKL